MRNLPDLGQLVAEARIMPQEPDPTALAEMLEAARRDLVASQAVRATSPGWADAILYEAGLRCARITVQAAGFRIAVDRAHVTAIDAADALTQGREHTRFTRLHRMRRVRHDFMYESAAEPSDQDLAQARLDVDALLELAQEAIDKLR